MALRKQKRKLEIAIGKEKRTVKETGVPLCLCLHPKTDTAADSTEFSAYFHLCSFSLQSAGKVNRPKRAISLVSVAPITARELCLLKTGY